MASSLRRTGETPPITDKGHGTKALGPSDSSDTGSDIVGAPGLDADDDALGLQRSTPSDREQRPRRRRKGAGPDIGDENLDSDSDSTGTGERAAAGRDAPPPNDEQLGVINSRGDSEPVSDADLERELVEEDREYGDEAVPDEPADDGGSGAGSGAAEKPLRNEPSASGNAPAQRRKPARSQFGVRRRKR